MADETIELTEVQAVLDGLSSPTDEQFMQALRGYSDTGVSLAAAKRGLGGGGGGSLPDWWVVGADEGFEMQPTDQTTDSPFLNMLCDYSQLVDESGYGYVINVRPVGSAPGDGDQLFSVSVTDLLFTSAPGEGAAKLRIKSADHLSANTVLGITGGGDAYFSLLKEGGDGNLDLVRLQSSVGADTLFTLPGLPSADPVIAGQVWNDAGTLKVSAG